MNMGHDKVGNSPEKMPLEKNRIKSWIRDTATAPKIAFLDAILSLIVSIVSIIAAGIASSRMLPSIPPAYLMIFGGVIAAVFGLGTAFSLAINLYRRQIRERQLSLKKLRTKEEIFFRIIESDITTMLSEVPTLLKEGDAKWQTDK